METGLKIKNLETGFLYKTGLNNKTGLNHETDLQMLNYDNN